ncbi:LysM domain-containing protein [bacterium]|nr:LysM domain-containing protein [bacterium]
MSDLRIGGSSDVRQSSSSGNDDQTVTVRSDENNLSDVARRLGFTEQELRQANPQISNSGNLNPGQEIRLPLTRNQQQQPPSQSSSGLGSPQPREAPDRGRATERSIEGQARQAQLRNYLDVNPLNPDMILGDVQQSLPSVNEETIGRDMARNARQDPSGSRAPISQQMNRLASEDRDDVAYEFTRRLNDQQLRNISGSRDGQQTLNRMEQELLRGSVSSDERLQANRIHNVLGSAQLNPQSRAEVLVNRHTYGSDLNEEQLGRELGRMSRQNPAGSRATVDAVMNSLGSVDRDDVAYQFTRNLSHEQLRNMRGSADGRAILDRMRSEMNAGNTSDSERNQMNRIDTARAAVNLELNPAFTGLTNNTRSQVRDLIERHQTNPSEVNNVINLSTNSRFGSLSETTQGDMLNALGNRPGDSQFLERLRSLANNVEFRGLSEASRTNVVHDVNRFAGTQSYREMSTSDRTRALSIISNLSLHSAGNPANVSARNTLNHLISGRIGVELYNHPSSTDFGRADDRTMFFNVGNPQISSNRRELVATAAHEVNHVVNGDTSSGTRERFLDEYRAFYMEHSANGNGPTVSDMREAVKYLATNPPNGSAYDHLRELYRDDPGFESVVRTVKLRLYQTPPVITTPEELRLMLRRLPEGAESTYLNRTGNLDNN